jgi:hypothetical protein
MQTGDVDVGVIRTAAAIGGSRAHVRPGPLAMFCSFVESMPTRGYFAAPSTIDPDDRANPASPLQLPPGTQFIDTQPKALHDSIRMISEIRSLTRRQRNVFFGGDGTECWTRTPHLARRSPVTAPRHAQSTPMRFAAMRPWKWSSS